MIQLTICISTYKRPLGLEMLLYSISKQKDIEKYDTQISIAIADNQTPPLTEAIAEKFRNTHGLMIQWQHEPTQGISYARNTSFKLAAGADLCLFVDDDEVLDEYCISELLRVRQEFDADLVYGNSPPVFAENNPPPYIKQFFEFDNGEDGQELPFAPTNCLLLDKAVLKGVEEPFAHEFAHSGGEDTFLTSTLVKNGARLVRSRHANAYNLVPADKCSVRWILSRVKQKSATFSLITLRLNVGIRGILTRSLKLVIKFIYGSLISLPFLLFARRKRLTGLMLIWEAVGGFLGFFKYKSNFYNG